MIRWLLVGLVALVVLPTVIRIAVPMIALVAASVVRAAWEDHQTGAKARLQAQKKRATSVADITGIYRGVGSPRSAPAGGAPPAATLWGRAATLCG